MYQIFHMYQMKNLYSNHFQNVYIFTSWQRVHVGFRNVYLKIF